MRDFVERGKELRRLAKDLVYDFMRRSPECSPTGEGIRQAVIFRKCGFDWGDYSKASSTNQQYWVVALLRELEAEGWVERVSPSGPWRLRDSTGTVS